MAVSLNDLNLRTIRPPKSRYALLVCALTLSPVVLLVPILFLPIPTMRHVGVSTAGYFQTLAIARDGVQSFYYLTPLESTSSLHLHSLISAVLFKLGVFEAGRVVSLLSAVATGLLLAWLAGTLYNRRIAIVTVALFWVHPLVPYFASRWFPEMLGVALTTGAVAAGVHDGERDGWAWYTVSLACIVLGITNHYWEATIAAPLVLLFTARREYVRVGGVVSITVLSLVIVEYIKRLQPESVSLASAYSVVSHPEMLFSLKWLFHGSLRTWPPISLAVSLTVPLAIIACATTGVWWFTSRDERSLLTFGWLASGLAILFLLPRGWIYHDYYLWALLAPLALFGGVVLERGFRAGIRVSGQEVSLDAAVSVCAVVLLIVAATNIAVFEVRPAQDGDYTQIGEYRTEELIQAGEELRSTGVRDANQIVFVGDWSSSSSDEVEDAAVARVLAYGHVSVTERQFASGGGGAPTFAANVAAVDQATCKAMVIRSESGISVRNCQ